jgi:type III pantothenate kinase
MTGTSALLVDVGNTRIKWGVLRSGEIGRTGNITQKKLRDVGLASLTTRLPRKVDDVLISNVAGSAVAMRLSAVIGLHCDTIVRFAHSQRKACGVTNSYRQPRRLGVDRWVAMIGAYSEFVSSLCIVDAGTAVTIDAVDKSGQHLGGQIIAGLEMMTNALRAGASDIPLRRRRSGQAGDGIEMFATNTDGATSNGAINAVCGAIERATRVMRSAGHRPKIVLTGGDASRILKPLPEQCVERPDLVLQGLAQLVESEP